MKVRTIFLTVSVLAAASLSASSLRAPLPASGPGRVSVLVRVFDGKQFVSGLGIKDFEVLQNDFSCSVDAVHEVRKNSVVRSDGDPTGTPVVARKFFLIFQLTEYHPKLQKAMDLLFRDELEPGDAMDIQTPVRNYALTPQALQAKPREVLAKELSDIVNRDVSQGAMAYNSVLRDLKRIVRSIAGSDRGSLGDTEGDDAMSTLGLESQLEQYKTGLAKMEDLRNIDEAKLIRFAGSIKAWPGQKHIFYVYQREFRPEINANTLDQLMLANQDRPNVQADLQDVFAFYHRTLTLNDERIKRAFADSGASFHLLFTNKRPERIAGATMREQSEDVFKIFSQVAAATGGIVDTSEEPDAAMKSALRAAESVYQVVFTPSATGPQGMFNTLAVRVKGREYKVIHPIGYYQ
jgi:hypothetical protein